MKKPSLRAKPFIETRNHHESELAEDYVEIISDLILLKGEARVLDIAEYLGVSHVTVIRTIERLRKKGFLQTSSHQPVVLTTEGEKLAKFCKERHQFLLNYLITLGVPENIAAIDVEGMEHHVSETTMNAFRKHLKD
jgi:DtxR family manganese transport transcriptional regulator